MKIKDKNTEQLILSTAEKIFMEKGYAATRTTEIAKAAGVNHAMLHYYFRTKENLFNRIFEEKANLLLNFFLLSFEDDIPFLDKIKRAIEFHFDYIAQNPNLPTFVIREVLSDESKRELIVANISPHLKEALRRMQRDIDKEAEKGVIRSIDAFSLLINIVSLNVFSFVSSRIFFVDKQDKASRTSEAYLLKRKRTIVSTIINSLKIN